MSLIRAEAEENYLNFLPPNVRRPLRDFYNRGALVSAYLATSPRSEMFHFGDLLPSAVPYQGDFSDGKNPKTWFEAKNQFMNGLYAQRFTPIVRGRVDVFNTSAPQPLSPIPQVISSIEDFELQLAKLTGHVAKEIPFPKFTDDAALLRVNLDGSNFRVYTLIRNREHKNLLFASFENSQRILNEDVMLAAPGIITSYPNRYYVIDLKSSGEFLNALASLTSKTQQSAFIDRYSVSRHTQEFWKVNDWFQNYFVNADPVNNGILDLSRYGAAEEENLK